MSWREVPPTEDVRIAQRVRPVPVAELNLRNAVLSERTQRLESSTVMADEYMHEEFGDMDPPPPTNHGACSLALRLMHDQLHADIVSVLDNVKAVIDLQRDLADTITHLRDSSTEVIADDLLCVDCSKNRNAVDVPLDKFDEALMGANKIVPLVQLTCILTVASFGLNLPNAQCYIPTATLEALQEDKETIMKGSGLALLAYSDQKNKKRKESPPGVAYMHAMFIREAWMSAIDHARNEIFYTGAAGQPRAGEGLLPTAPSWILAMHPENAVRATILRIMGKLDPIGVQPKAKRRRRSISRSVTPTSSCVAALERGSAPGTSSQSSLSLNLTSRASRAEAVEALKRSRASDGRAQMTGHENSGVTTPAPLTSVEKDAFLREEKRVAVVMKLRKHWYDFLNHTRTETRKFLHSRVMFLSEFIRTNYIESREEGVTLNEAYKKARDDGYEIVFKDEKAKEELKMPATQAGTIWDIPFADVGDTKCIHEMAGGSFNGPDTNQAKLKKLKDDFSCLKITLRYSRELRRDPGATSNEQVVLQWEEDHWLHDIAQDLLMERFRVKDFRSLLSISGLSLRAIHVLAIAIRGLIRLSLDMAIETVEVIALGEAIHRDVEDHEMFASTKITEDSIAAKTQLEKKMFISQNEYDKVMASPVPPSPRGANVATEAASFPTDGIAPRDRNRRWMSGRPQ